MLARLDERLANATAATSFLQEAIRREAVRGTSVAAGQLTELVLEVTAAPLIETIVSDGSLASGGDGGAQAPRSSSEHGSAARMGVALGVAALVALGAALLSRSRCKRRQPALENSESASPMRCTTSSADGPAVKHDPSPPVPPKQPTPADPAVSERRELTCEAFEEPFEGTLPTCEAFGCPPARNPFLRGGHVSGFSDVSSISEKEVPTQIAPAHAQSWQQSGGGMCAASAARGNGADGSSTSTALGRARASRAAELRTRRTPAVVPTSAATSAVDAPSVAVSDHFDMI